jgi:hypothetical protein
VDLPFAKRAGDGFDKGARLYGARKVVSVHGAAKRVLVDVGRDRPLRQAHLVPSDELADGAPQRFKRFLIEIEHGDRGG